MLALGIDIVDITRFSLWHTYPPQKLARVFAHEESTYCLSVPAKSVERFAGRFAAKEALFKALSQMPRAPKLSLLRVFKHAQLRPSVSGPFFQVEWHSLGFAKEYTVHVSFSHTATTACAVVAISEK